MTVDPKRIQQDIDWDLDRLPLPIGERASDAALDRLGECEPDQRPTVLRVLAELRGDAPAGAADANDYLRAAKHAGGDVAIVTWSSTGATAIRWDPETERYQVAGYSHLDKRLGNEPTFVQHSTRGQIKDILGSAPQVVMAEETDLLPGGDSA
ncbi:hypothetical protein [Halosimplex sp. J119]